MIAFSDRPAAASVPTCLPVPHLAEAVSRVVGSGGAVTSEVRTAPGIASWVFVADHEGNEHVLWEDATSRP